MDSATIESMTPAPRSSPRVLVVVGDFPQASETFIFNQVAGLLDAGVEVEVFAEGRAQGGLAHEIVTRYRLIERTRFATDLLPSRLAAKVRSWRLGQWARQASIWLGLAQLARDYDVYLCHFGPIGERVAKLKRLGLLRGQVWTAFHGYDLSRTLQTESNPYPALLEHGDRLLPVSQLWRDRLLQLGAREDRILIHGMGVDCDEIPYKPRDAVPDRPVRILSVARLVEKKGLAYGLEALAQVRRRRPEASWDYVIVGGGALREPLEAQARALGLEDRVAFRGELTGAKVTEELEQADVFLLPSVTAADGDMETIPVALKEAMASGAATVSTYHGGIPELIEHDVSGLLAPERDALTLGANLERLIVEPATRARLAAAARRVVEDHWDNRRLNRRLADLMRAALSSESASSLAAPYGDGLARSYEPS